MNKQGSVKVLVTMNERSQNIMYSIALAICGCGLAYFFYAIADQCPKFEQGTLNTERPIVEVVQSFWIAFAIYVVAWGTVGGFRVRRPTSASISWLDLGIVFSFGIFFRVILTPTAPIQEIDLYRYVWDGAVFANGLDPYFYGPETVLNASGDSELRDRRVGLEDYTDVLEKRPGLKGVLQTIHYGNYTSPYPPVSQFFFASSIAFVHKDADKLSYIKSMKIMLVIFDVLTGVLIAFLLYHVGMKPSLCLAYLWCPLVLKEIANGGHLDSIATFFVVLAVYLATRAVWPKIGALEVNDLQAKDGKKTPPNDKTLAKLPVYGWVFSSGSAIALAAAFSAKVFPLVLIPVWFVTLMRTGLKSFIALFLFALAAYLFSLPMLKHLDIAKRFNLVPTTMLEQVEEADPSGLEAFSKFWEMNDFLFMFVVENLKPTAEEGINYSYSPWFRVTSNGYRKNAVNKIRPWIDRRDESGQIKTQYKPANYAFFATRAITMGVFCLIVGWCCFTLLFDLRPIRWLEMVFLTLAWFWLLSPTQNPWYWTWAMPFLVFAKGRTWFLLSGCALTYYLRFWFEYQYKNVAVVQHWKSLYGDQWYFDWLFPMSDRFAYTGNRFFDMYIPVLEFGPLLILLAVAALSRLVWGRMRSSESAEPIDPAL